MKTYFRVETFALGSTEGGSWEPDKIVSGSTPEKAFQKGIKFLKKQGMAFEVKLTLCDKNGEDFQ